MFNEQKFKAIYDEYLTSGLSIRDYCANRHMRRSFYTLNGMVTNQMGRNVQQGDVFIFVNRLCNGMKILHMECGGLVIFHMKLESGCFKLPIFDGDTRAFQTSWQELMMMVQGGCAGEKANKKRWKNPLK